MNIVLLGHEDLASAYALDTVIKACPQHAFTVFWSGAVAPRKQAAPTLDRLEAVDRRSFERYLARATTSPRLREATELRAPNGPEGMEALRQLHPDLLVSIRYRRILRESAIAIPLHGVLNLHSGILPDYRGVMATFWAMLAGETEIGTTLHRIVDGGIDTGPIVNIQRQAAEYSRSYLENVLTLYPRGCDRIVRAIGELESTGTLALTEQSTDHGEYFAAPSEADALDYVRQGLRLFPDADSLELDEILDRCLTG